LQISALLYILSSPGPVNSSFSYILKYLQDLPPAASSERMAIKKGCHPTKFFRQNGSLWLSVLY